MEILRIVLWIIAYTAGVVRLFVALLLFVRNRESGDFKKILFLIVFGLVMLSLSNMEVLNIFGSSKAYLAGKLGLIFSSLITITLPVYIHSEICLERPFIRDMIAAGAGIFSLGLLFIEGFSAMMIVSIIMSISIVYSMVMLAGYNLHPKRERNTSNVLTAAIVIVLILLMIFFDFLFPIAGGYVFIPVLYLFVNIMMLVSEIPLFSTSVGWEDDSELFKLMEDFGLSLREKEVAMLLIRGKSYQETGDELFISFHTVKTHAARIYRKTGAANKLELLDKLRKSGQE